MSVPELELLHPGDLFQVEAPDPGDVQPGDSAVVVFADASMPPAAIADELRRVADEIAS